MIFSVTNHSGIDVELYVGVKKYSIKAHSQPQSIEVGADTCIRVKRAEALLQPSSKQLLLSELLGGAAHLFSIAHSYTLDLSSQYKLIGGKTDFAEITIIRREKEPISEMTYDAVCLACETLDLFNVQYLAENKQQVTNTYKKSRRKAHTCLYVFIELAFVLLGMCVAYPVLMALYAATNIWLFKFAMVLFPSLFGGLIALVTILPLYFVYKYQDKDFYNHLEYDKIQSVLRE